MTSYKYYESYYESNKYYEKLRHEAHYLRENEEIDTLFKYQHEALASLCAFCHEIRDDPRPWTVFKSRDHAFYWSQVGNKFNSESRIEDYLKYVCLPPIQFPKLDYISDDHDDYYYYIHKITIDDERDRIHDSLHAVGIDTEDMQAAMYEYACYVSAVICRVIEDYLLDINSQYGTHYCPTDMSRSD